MSKKGQKSKSRGKKTKKNGGKKAAAANVLMNEVEELIARQKCYDVLTRYCRALDRCDLDLMKTVYWADSSESRGIFEGDALEFAAFIIDEIQTLFEATQHAICNVHMEFDGDNAHVESYLLAYHRVKGTKTQVRKLFGAKYMAQFDWTKTRGTSHDFFFGGRYIDRLERREGEWRIAERTAVMDWNQNGLSTAIWNEGIHKQLTTRGARGPGDPVYQK